ncbi:hypothetical protein [Rhodomicrobium udaipurense]|uniref:Uncharacterized protein n=1 Tax=Rhodomicrobium udaipurense TaxID=1202716 RepID=A0A8I1GFY2_9HYPH|nr:hypothetical protein [Rhodomicrobium udaipurense]MBJ7543081.1 hypothetical protein [Rhodomicrobium udaipurense]
MWTWQKFDDDSDGITITREIATNDIGVSIEPWGTQGAGKQIMFKYSHGDIEIELTARRSPKSVTHQSEIKFGGADFPLGPICQVWFDDRKMTFIKKRPLTVVQRLAIEETFSDFLTTTFRDCSYSVPPCAEQVEFY